MVFAGICLVLIKFDWCGHYTMMDYDRSGELGQEESYKIFDR